MGLHGIYPRALQIDPQIHAHFTHGEMPFLDLLLVPIPDAPRCRLLTRLYDKRVQPAFARARLSRLIPHDSNANESAKRNILVGQFHRLRRVITDPNNFCIEVAAVFNHLLTKGHSRARMVIQIRDLITAQPFLYHHTRGGAAPHHAPLDLLRRIHFHARNPGL